jgi:hypothetical protein
MADYSYYNKPSNQQTTKGYEMTGKEIAKAIKAHKGKVSIPALFGNDAPYIYAEKQDLVDHFSRMGDNETGCEFRNSNGDAFVDTVN